MKKANPFTVTGMLLFFCGLPVVGLLYFWTDMHSKMARDATGPGVTIMRQLASSWSVDDLDKLASQECALRQKDLDGWIRELGPLTDFGSPKVEKTWADVRRDRGYQFARLRTEAVFAKGKAELVWIIARPGVSPTWELDDLKVRPVSSAP